MPDVLTTTGFRDTFGAEPDVSADAPGRVNLIGEHTDYHDGYVLPTTLPQRTVVELRRRTDRVVRLTSTQVTPTIQQFVIGKEQPGCGWLDYVQGLTHVLRRHGYSVCGFDARVTSNIPPGAGVSSSAALEVAVLRALRAAGELALEDRAIAVLSREAETDFVGAPVGVMDPMACSLGRPDEALFIDTRTLEIRRLKLPEEAELVVIHSGITHAHATGGYSERRRESMEAAARLGVHRLRDCTPARLPDVAALPPLLARRARHVITENQRVLNTVAALERGDLAAVGRLLNASHASMRDDYEVSTKEVDALVAIAQSEPHVFGARMTGGGFGGSVVMLVKAGSAAAVADRIAAVYRDTAGQSPTVLVPENGRVEHHGR